MSVRTRFCTIAVFFILCSTALATSPVQKYGQLSVQGNKILDSGGKPVQLRGMSLFWSQWIGKYWNADVVNWLADDWKVTIVRAAMAVEQGGYLTNPDAEKRKVQAVVDAAIAKGIYVIIDWHDHNAHNNLDQAKAFFAEMAQTYGSYPNVLYEIYNEPEAVSWSGVVKPYAEAVIAQIRTYDPDNLILVGTPRWCQDVEAAADDPISGTNIAYALHFYAASHKESLRQAALNALNKGVALFVSEWGTCEYTGDGYLDEEETRTWFSFMDQHKLSWCNWSIADKAETAAALKGGASASGGWPQSQLTPSGMLLRNTLREYAAQEGSGGSGGGDTGTTPSDTILLIPGKIEAEAFNAAQGVQTETTTDSGGGMSIGYIDNGDWVEYAVEIRDATQYTVKARVASETSGGSIRILVDNADRGSLAVSGTGGWQNWTTVQTQADLPSGNRTLRLQFEGSGTGLFNLNWVSFEPIAATAAPLAPAAPTNHLPAARAVNGGIRLMLPVSSPFTTYTVHSPDGRIARKGHIDSAGSVAIRDLPQGVWMVSLRGDNRAATLSALITM